MASFFTFYDALLVKIRNFAPIVCRNIKEQRNA